MHAGTDHPPRRRVGAALRVAVWAAAALLLLGRHGSSVAAEAGVAPGAPQSNAAATDALELTQQLLARANRLEQERKLEEAFETAREASRTLQSATGLAELGRLYLQGTIESLFGKIFAENRQYEQAIASWNDALSSYAPLYNADAEFWRRASQPGSPFKDAAANITVTLDFMAQVYELQKKPEEALKQLGLKTTLLEKIDDDEQVLECRQRSLKIIEANPSLRFAERRRAQMLMAIGVALTNVGRPGEALPVLEQASTILSPVPRTPDPELAPARVNARLFTGYTLQALGRDSEALPILRSAAADLTAGGADETEQLRALERVFVSLYRLGQFAEAMDVLKQRIDLAHRTSGMEAREFAARIHLTLVHYQLGDYPAAKAESADLKRLAVNTKIPLEDRVRAYANDGVINRDAKDFRAAADSFGAAIGLLETEPGTEAQRARYHIDVAKALSALRRPDDARAALERGLRLVAGDADHAVVAAELRRSIALDDEGRLGKPGAVARQCQQIISTLSKTPSADELMLRCLVDIGRDHQQAGRADDAIAAFRNAADRLSPAGENAVSVTELGGNSDKQHQRWVVMTGLGLALAAAGRSREAAVQLIAASELARNRIGTGLTAVPILTRYRLMAADTRYAAAGRIAVALSFQSPDVDVVRSFEMAIAGKGLFTEISRRQTQALRAAGVRDPALMKRYVDLRQQVARHVIDWQRSDGTPGTDSEVVERLFKEIGDIEVSLMRSAAAGTAESTADRTRAAPIVASLSARDALLEFVRFVPLTPPALRALDVDSLTSDDVERQHYGVFLVSGTTRRITPIDLGPVRQIDDAVLAYRAIQQRQAAPESFKLDEPELSAAGERLRRLAFDPLAAQLKGVSRIYVAPEGTLSLVPFEAFPVSGLGSRYLVEDYELVYLATGRDLVPAPSPAAAPRSRDIWLIGDPDFDATQAALRASAAGGVTTTRPARGSRANETLVADVQRMGSPGGETLRNWPRLERTGDLLDKIAATATAANMRPVLLTGARASEASLAQMHAPRVAVFATHGKFVDRSSQIRGTLTRVTINSEGSSIEGLSDEELLAADPLFRSVLALAGANATPRDPGDDAAWDGLLTAYEVWGLDLQGAELVALTACETGLGVVQSSGPNGSLQQPSGEVIAGLRQAFVVAGAKSIVMSMWPVPLNETVSSLAQFFDSWLRSGEGRYVAFRRSQLDALRTARERRGSGHPFWWAGFVYFGAPADVPGR